jgi:hypothetical protein
MKETAFYTKNLSECIHFPMLKKLPLPIQKLTCSQLRIAYQYVANHVEVKKFQDKLVCCCKFFCQYWVPCRHLWQRELMYGIFTEEDWNELAFQFEEHGMDIYETWEKSYIERIPDETASLEEQYTLKAREQ